MTHLSEGGVFESLIVSAVFFTVGIILCAVYDLFRLLRYALIKGRTFVFLIDILFSMFAACSLYIAFLALNNGMVRTHLLLCAAVGFWLWRLTVSTFLLPILAHQLSSTVGVFSRFFGMLFRWIGAVGAATMRTLSLIGSKLSNIFGKDVKKDLQHPKV